MKCMMRKILKPDFEWDKIHSDSVFFISLKMILGKIERGKI
jgi:hypothetical protein